MISNINSFKTMEQFFNTSWFIANVTTIWIGLKAKFIFLQAKLTWLTVDQLRYYALVIGLLSTLVFLGYNLSKWYQQVLETKKFKRKEKITNFFKFTEDEYKNLE